MTATDEEAKALYEEWAREAIGDKRAPWSQIDDREKWAWRRVLSERNDPVSLIGAALRYRLGRMALEALKKGQWIRPWLLLRMSLLVIEKDDIPF